MFQVSVGHSNDPDADFAVKEVLEQCKTALGSQIPKAGLLFAAIDYEHDIILQQIYDVFPALQLIGGSTDGEISSTMGFQQDSLVLMLFVSDEVDFIAGVGRQVAQNPEAIAQAAVQEASEKIAHPVKLCITTPESLTTSCTQILNGFQDVLGDEVPIVGGTTADQRDFKATFQFFKTEILQDSAPFLLLSGNLLVGHSVSSGWLPMGKHGIVTKVEHNILHEVDHRSALEFAQSIGISDPSPEYRIAVFEPESAHWYVRNLTGYDEETGKLFFYSDIPVNAKIQIVQATRTKILDELQLTMNNTLGRYPGQTPSAALLFSCANRRHLLGTHTQQEYQMAATAIGREVPICGFYTYGEIAPLSLNSRTYFHNEAFISLLIGTQ